MPLAAAVSGKATRLLGVPQGSAAEQSQEMAPEGVDVVAALHTVSAPILGDLERELDEDVLIAGDSKAAKLRAAEIVRRIPGLRPVDAGRLEQARHIEADHATPDLGQRAQQDARRHQADGSRRTTLVALLSGGTGGAKLARGLAEVAGELAVIANTADDVEVYGVHVSPDPDLVSYWLADAIDERGWGLRDDTWKVMEALEASGRPHWFRLGDRDLAMCLVRTERLRAGRPLTEAQRGCRRPSD